MKSIITIAFSFFILQSFGASIPSVYYFSYSTGNDNNTPAQAQNPATPWKSIDRLNALLGGLSITTSAGSAIVLTNPGDNFLLKRGDVFPISSTITPKKNGTASNPYVIADYGSGAKPVITSFQRITNWTAVSGRANVYTSFAIPGGSTNITSLLVNGNLAAVGRWPNATAPYGGYLELDTHSSTSFTDNNYGIETNRPTDNWTGAEVAIRNFHFRFSTQPVTSNTLNSSGGMTFNWTSSQDWGYGAWGYFLQNHVACLDQHTEWCYNKSTDQISIYLSSNPSNYDIEVPTLDKFFYLDYAGYSINNIEFAGCNHNGLETTTANSFFNVRNCTISYVGYCGLRLQGTNNFIDNNFFYNILTDAIYSMNSYTTITNNIIRNTMPVNGMNYNQGGQGTAIEVKGSYLIVDSNRIYNSAACAFDINKGSHSYVRANFSDSALVRIDDVGIIYTVNQDYDTLYFDKRVENNILIHNNNFTSTYLGLARQYNQLSNVLTNALYGDQWTDKQVYKGNIIAGSQIAMYINDALEDTIINNIFYNFTKVGFNLNNSHQPGTSAFGVTSPSMHNNYAAGNVYFSTSTSTSPPISEWFSAKSGTPSGYGTFTNQYFVYPLAQTNDQYYNAGSRMSWSTWNSTLGYDPAKTIYRAAVPSGATSSTISKLIYNDTKHDSIIYLDNKVWKDAKDPSIVYSNNQITLSPFTGKVLILSSGTTTTGSYPTVSITQPANNSSVNQSTNLAISASAADADGTVSKVDFYNGSTLMGSDNTSPYAYVYNNIPAGNYSFTAKATDNTGNATLSSPVSVSVIAPNIPPSINISSPANNSSYVFPATISITTNATDNDGFISKVDFYSGSTLLGTDNAPPFNFTINNAAAGSYSVTAKATDNAGAATISAPVNFNVRQLVAPNVSITYPANNSAYTAPASVVVSASASDLDGTVSKVDFYLNNVLVNTDATSPYSYSLVNLGPGTYNVLTKATDNDGLTTTSSVITFTVSATQKPPTINITSPINGSSFVDPAQINLTASAADADGTVVRVDFFANGQLLGSDNAAPFSLTYSSVMAGTYSFTAKATDNDGLSTTSNAVGVTVTHVNINPTIDIIDPVDKDSSAAGQSFAITAVANDADGTINKVEFYNGSALVSTVTAAPFTISVKLPVGVYTLTAKAYDNSGGTAFKSITHSVVQPKSLIISGHKAIIVGGTMLQ